MIHLSTITSRYPRPYALIWTLITCLCLSPTDGKAATELQNCAFYHNNSFRQIALRSVANELPFVETFNHDVGKMFISMQNTGIIGPDIYRSGGGRNEETFMEYPRGSIWSYPTPHLIIGGVVDRDTLVTTPLEFWPASLQPQLTNQENLTLVSINDTGAVGFAAHSEQDISCIYYDTLVDLLLTPLDELDNRSHRPLKLKIKQTSYAWSYEYAEDFIIIDFRITNIGTRPITKAFLGIDVQGGYQLDIFAGYKPVAPAFLPFRSPCEFEDSVQLFWCADNDGNPASTEPKFEATSPTAVTAIKILRTPGEVRSTSFNWWDDNGGSPGDFGPRRAGTTETPLRNIGGSLGHPLGDRNRYFVLSSGEIDYDQMFTAVDHSSEGWLPPPPNAVTMAFGPGFGDHNHHHNMIAVGPFDVNPGQTLPFTYAYVAGENFHQDPDNTLDPFNPQPFYNKLNFDELVKNSTWAGWVFDNPGVDSNPDDSNFYRGEFRVCVTDDSVIIGTTYVIDTTVTPPDTISFAIDTVTTIIRADTIYYTGDGIPDLLAASPPPTPDIRYVPELSRITVEWYGLKSETTPDVFTKEIDFEGYRIYLGLARRNTDLILLSSYDIEDYTQYFFDLGAASGGDWVVLRKPFSRQEIQLAYAEGRANYDPLDNGIDNPLRFGDSLFYFVSQDWNQSNFRDVSAMHKIYPDEPYPHTLNLDSAFSGDTQYIDPYTGDTTFYVGGELTPDGKRFKYFEYRYIIENILPSQKYFVSVTAFDFGSQQTGLSFLETNPVTSAIEVFPLPRVEQDAPGGLDVVIYPNPYRIDGNYRLDGFEGRGREDLPDFRVRTINFINLPPQCKISIYSLDGDLVREIEHDQPLESPSSMRETWNLISRNTQIPVSGIYYWVVETPSGETQIGKLVLIM